MSTATSGFTKEMARNIFYGGSLFSRSPNTCLAAGCTASRVHIARFRASGHWIAVMFEIGMPTPVNWTDEIVEQPLP